MRDIRVFVSSPSDAAHERRRVERVVERLNGAFADDVRLSAVRWEASFYSAHATFQVQIPEAADCDVVIAIFRARLGTELPSGFPSMPDGEAYPSGTAYEVLSAIEARKNKDLPDVYVFRYPAPPSVTLDDPAGEAVVRDQWARLKAFFERWFITDGQFKAAFQTYDDVDRFEEQVETLLRRWLEEHVLGARTLAWPIATKGSPFRGLEAFGAKHADVFFGRERDIERAVDALKDAAASHDGLPFLLLIGPSGSGKSSLARAGLLPRLTASGVVPEVDVWRTVVMRPTDVAGAFLSLATRLFDDATDIPDAESGRPKALPELREGDHANPRELADLLSHADETALKPILKALDRVAAQEQSASGSTRSTQARLLLVVDQLDELLGADIDGGERERFARLLALLAGTGRVWIVGTLRADLYELYSAEPDLLALKKRGAVYDVEPAGAAALEEIVRKPAAAAGLAFDERTLPDGRRQRLDERLIGDAERPDMLPLVQFTLNRLFEERETGSGASILSHAAYDRLGGLDGAIAQEAERALAGLSEIEQNRLPRLLRQLVSGADGDAGETTRRLAIRSVAYAEAAHDGPSKALVDALIAARILLGEGGTGAAASSRQVRLAHQRVLEAWPRARDIVSANARFFRIKPEVERAEVRWLENGRPANLLLPRGVALSEAEEIARTFGDEIAPATRTYIQASSWRVRRTLTLAVAAAAIFALVAVGAGTAGYLAYRAEQQATAARDAAERNFALARQTIDAAIFEFVQAFKNTDGIKGAVLQRVLTSTRQALDRLAAAAPGDNQLQRSRAVLSDEFGDLLFKAGDRAGALAAYEESLTIFRTLAKRYPDFTQRQRDVSVSLVRIGDLRASAGDRAGALAAYEESLTIRRTLTKRDPDNTDWQRDMAVSLSKVGDLRAAAGDRAGALAAYEECLIILRTRARRDPDNTQWQGDVAAVNIGIGGLRASAGDRAGALAAYEESLIIRRTLTKRDPDNTEWQSDLSVSLVEVGDLRAAAGDRDGALAAYEESLAIRRTLVRRDPDNTEWQRDVSLSLYRVGDLWAAAGDRAGALAAYEESLTIARTLARRDSDNTEWQRAVSASLSRAGDLRAAAGDRAGALAAYEECLIILRTLAQRDPDNTQWQGDVAAVIIGIGGLRAAAGDRAGALAAYEEGLTIRRTLVKRDPDNTQWQRDVSLSLDRLGNLKAEAGDGDGALAAYDESLTILRTLARRNPPNTAELIAAGQLHQKRGDSLRHRGQAAMAAEDFEAALKIGLTLAASTLENEQKAQVAAALGNLSFELLFVSRDQQALNAADAALALAPNKRYIRGNRAYALMFLGRTEQARTAFLDPSDRGQPIFDSGEPVWEEAVRSDFKELREAGRSDPLMKEILSDFSKSQR